MSEECRVVWPIGNVFGVDYEEGEEREEGKEEKKKGNNERMKE